MLIKSQMLSRGLLAAALFATTTTLCLAKDEPTKAEPAKAEATKDPEVSAKTIVATVNGVDITMQDLGEFLNYQRSANPGKQPNPANIMDEVINRELIKQEALKQGTEKRPEFIQDLEFQRSNLLVNTLLAKQIDKADLSDEALKKEYDAQVKGVDLTEYKARHILTKKEDEAKEIIKLLKDGGDFAALAKEKSTGPSGPNGGDLGWFQAASMVPEFAAALKGMKKGESSQSPVKTQFGWHVIKLEDSRKKEAPTFEASKDRLKTIVANKAVQDYLKGLRESAKIDIKEGATPGHGAPH
jgi:peptidyl-prolyl cis-trans isomerase C